MIRQSDVLDLHRALSEQVHLGLNLLDAYSPLPEIFSQDILQSIKDQGTGADAFLLMLTRRLNQLLAKGKKRSQLATELNHTVNELDVTSSLYQTRMVSANNDKTATYYCGLMPTTVNTAAALKTVIEHWLVDYIEKVEIEECVGSWLAIPDEQKSRLGKAGSFNRLGLDVMLGEKQWSYEQKLVIRLCVKEQLEKYKWQEMKQQSKAIKQMINSYLDSAIEYEVAAVINPNLGKAAQLNSANGGSELGADSWLGNLNETTQVVL